ncbi:MAG TPA: tRNA pseudouridine(55) synthase TruB [Chloroflexi bacterium]|nr:tRNA pseudouridine(55) synthase TruB [Chloroflexota bacterium]
MDGILNLNKPAGLTSHDVVDRVRAVARQRKVGHAGTLDPMATGVLLVCLGRATRVAEYLMASPKTYRARVRLGVTTDTYDAEGSVVEERPVEVDRAAVERALERFRGRILQVPPMYSALKHKGKRLYELARRGEVVEREPRPVEVYRLELVEWTPPELVLELDCSPGTYVRALAHDLGEALGCGAHLAGLVRLASGDFRLEEATPLEELTRERLPSLLLPIDAALRRYPALHLDEARARAVRTGQAVAGPPPPEATGDLLPLARAYGPDGTFLAVVEYRPDRGTWHPRKVFA